MFGKKTNMLLSGLWEQLIIGSLVALFATVLIIAICEAIFKEESETSLPPNTHSPIGSEDNKDDH